MIFKKATSWVWFTLTLLSVGLLVWVVLPAPVAEAGLPPRWNKSICEPVKDREKDKDDKPLGAWIELQAPGTPAGGWAMVQWQDSLGNWHDVEGWQGTLDGSGGRRWWVAAKDFGSGPFRWLVRPGPNGPQVGVSQPFTLPTGANETVPVTVLVK